MCVCESVCLWCVEWWAFKEGPQQFRVTSNYSCTADVASCMYVACTYIQLCTGIRAEGRFRKTHDREVWRMRRVYGKKRILELEGMARSQIFLYIFRYIFVDIYFDIYIYILIFLMRGVWCGVCI